MKARKQVILFHHALRQGGGMEQYALSLVRAFRGLGWEVTFCGQGADLRLAEELGVELLLNPVSRWIPGKLKDWKFYRLVKRLAPRLEGLQIALSRVPVRDLIICGGTHRGYLRAAHRITGPQNRLQIRLEHDSYAAARTIISHSDLCTEELTSFYSIPRPKIRTMYPPVDIKRFGPGDATASRKALGLPLDKTILLFPSMGHRRKGFPELCKALQPFGGDILLAVAGKPAACSRFPFLRPLGYVQDMVAAYRAADFTILGSRYEPFGLVGPESVLCGTRLIFEDRIGCLPVLAQNAAIRFTITDPSSLIAALEQALALKRSGKHRLNNPRSALRYNPDPVTHAKALAQSCNGS